MDRTDRRCRICLGTPARHDLFSAEGGDDGGVPPRQMMAELFSVTVGGGDGMPESLCRKCHRSLLTAYGLKRLAEASYLRLLDERLDDKENREALVKTELPDFSSYDEDDERPLIYSKMVKVEVRGETNDAVDAVDAAERRRLPCQFCPKTFGSFGARRKHTLVHHLGRTYHCEECDKHYTCKYEHVRRVHSGAKRFACTLCDKRYHSRALLGYHMAGHSEEKPYPCPLCEQRFVHKASVRVHRRRVHDGEKNVICHFCSKAFFSKNHLLVHIRSHTKEKTQACPQCGKGFAHSSSLRNHLKRHAGAKGEKCDFCDMAFFTKGSALRTHLVSHTKEKNYACKYCGVKFGRSDHRNRHQKTAHESVSAGESA